MMMTNPDFSKEADEKEHRAEMYLFFSTHCLKYVVGVISFLAI